MTTYKFIEDINNGDQIKGFKPQSDLLEFDDTSFSAASGSISSIKGGLQFTYGGKTFTLSGVTLGQLATSNVKFDDGSKLLVGDDSSATTNDDSNNSLSGGELNDYLFGLGGNDSLAGNAGDDILDGGTGSDTMVGGSGADTYFVDDASDQTLENSNEGTDLVKASIDCNLLANNVENLTLMGDANLSGTGNALNNVITGNSGNNNIDGGSGNDLLIGGQGDDLLKGGPGNDTLIGGDGNDIYDIDSSSDKIIGESPSETGGHDIVSSSVNQTLGDNIEDLKLTGTSNLIGIGNVLANSMTGNAGDNTLDGGSGIDTLMGGDGNDIYVLDNKADLVLETNKDTSSSAIDLIESSVTYTLPENVEWLQLLGTKALDATGNASNNFLFATAGDNVFDGGSGGSDTVSYSYTAVWFPTDIKTADTSSSIALAGVTVSLDPNDIKNPQNTVGSGTDTLRNIDNLVGSRFNDSLTGNSGDNILDGGYGADTLTGGDGNDTYYVDSADVVVETNADTKQTDTVYSSVSYLLGSNLENLNLIGTSDINGTGNNLSNIITGNTGKNFLAGGAGADSLIGGTGDDRYLADNSDTITENTSGGTDTVLTATGIKNDTLPANVENLMLLGSQALNGIGNTLANVIYANSANNSLDGVANSSSSSKDTVSYEFGATAGVTVNLSLTTLQKTGGSGNDTLKGFANITGSNYDDFLTGTTPDPNNPKDTSGDNVLNGLAGSDTVSYENAKAGITVDLTKTTSQATGGGGTDTLLSIENLIGSDFKDTFIAGADNNKFDGGAESDTVSYAGSLSARSSLTIDLSVTTQQNTGGSSLDTFVNIENLIGSAYNDTLSGSKGANILNGGGGQDTLFGGAGKDIFAFSSIKESTVANPDFISDFKANQNKDKIDLSADSLYIGQFNFIGVKDFSNKAGELRYETVSENLLLVEGDVDGKDGADFAILVAGVKELVATDFTL